MFKGVSKIFWEPEGDEGNERKAMELEARNGRPPQALEAPTTRARVCAGWEKQGTVAQRRLQVLLDPPGEGTRCWRCDRRTTELGSFGSTAGPSGLSRWRASCHQRGHRQFGCAGPRLGNGVIGFNGPTNLNQQTVAWVAFWQSHPPPSKHSRVSVGLFPLGMGAVECRV
jgi:hypothetical protein